MASLPHGGEVDGELLASGGDDRFPQSVLALLMNQALLATLERIDMPHQADATYGSLGEQTVAWLLKDGCRTSATSMDARLHGNCM